MVHEPPSPCWFRCVGVAFAVLAEWCTANKLSCVAAFVGGLSTADAALHLFVMLTHLPLASCAATPAPSNVKFATVHTLPPSAASAAHSAHGGRWWQSGAGWGVGKCGYSGIGYLARCFGNCFQSLWLQVWPFSFIQSAGSCAYCLDAASAIRSACFLPSS